MCGEKPCEKKICTWSETHRRECEARELIRKPSDDRKAYYSKVQKSRGQKALDELRAEVNRQWAMRSTRQVGSGSATLPVLF